ncbi:MAG TPA: N-acetylmuramoyl-L-alanine amidase [Caldithrix abyssi]|uniref:N-acetylmuramoyl-L-alanine amidase n=1 Tax=Caldithrix abyssi TaxID=187145 RepID=A0A7V5PQ55_CALAY|nr:N-acetylmuramoyl-L-alanine amidase [Caldithrix abyssi]
MSNARTLFSLLLVLIMLLTIGCTNKTALVKESVPYPDSLHIILRQEWGWQPYQTKMPPKQTIRYITIHHGGVYFDPDSDAVKYIRHLQKWSREEKKWIDIPYHFMIDFKGHIYETRPLIYPGDTNTSYDPTGHALICVMGNFEEQVPGKQQLQALINLTAFLADYFHVPLEKIKGHKDYAETLCPGKNLYRYLQNGFIRKTVQQKLNKKSINVK